jgi:hypothetical protein
MAFGNRYDEQPREWIHRLYEVQKAEFLEAEIAANVADGYEPVSHSSLWNPEVGAAFTTVLYRRREQRDEQQ